MATAGTPESARPVSARSAISVGQLGAKAMATVAAAAAASEAAMTVLRPTRVRQRSRSEHGDRQHARRRRERQARGGGRHRERPRESRHQRLDAIEQREGAEAAEEQGEADAPEPRLAAQRQAPVGFRSGKARGGGRNRHGRACTFRRPPRKARQIPARRRGLAPGRAPLETGEKSRELLAFRPIFGKTVQEKLNDFRRFRQNSLRGRTGNFFADQGIKVPCSGENRDNSRIPRRRSAPSGGASAGQKFGRIKKRQKQTDNGALSIELSVSLKFPGIVWPQNRTAPKLRPKSGQGILSPCARPRASAGAWGHPH